MARAVILLGVGMLKIAFVAVGAILLPILGFSSEMNCRYTSTGMDLYWNTIDNPHLKKAPVMVTSGREKPLCLSNAYCKDNKGRVTVTKVFCFAIKEASEWKCPNANDCADDQAVVGINAFPTEAELGKPQKVPSRTYESVNL
jgi:hypothetical protein